MGKSARFLHSVLVVIEKAHIRIPITLLTIYLVFLLPVRSDEYELVVLGKGIQNMLVNVFIVILTLVLYVLTLYTVLAQEENDLVNRREQVLRLVESCSVEEVRREAREVLRVIDETLLDISRTWVRWTVYELPYAYTIVFSAAVTLYFYRALLQVDGWVAVLLPAHITWGKVLGMFMLILAVSGLALVYVFRRGYERRFLELYARSTRCLEQRALGEDGSKSICDSGS